MTDEARFINAKKQGYSWMLVCRDMYDAFDDDGGVYFETFKTRAEVDKKVEKSSGDQKVMGVYDLSLSFEEQYPGIASEDWVTGCSRESSQN